MPRDIGFPQSSDRSHHRSDVVQVFAPVWRQEQLVQKNCGHPNRKFDQDVLSLRTEPTEHAVEPRAWRCWFCSVLTGHCFTPFRKFGLHMKEIR